MFPVDPALAVNAVLALADSVAGLDPGLAGRAALVGGTAAATADGGDPLTHGVAVGGGAALGRGLADALSTRITGSPDATFARTLFRNAAGAAGVYGGRRLAKYLDEARQGRQEALRAYGLEKVAFGIGGLSTAGKWLGRGAKVLGTAPTGWGNLLAAGMGGVSGMMNAHAQGKSMGGMVAHGLAGAASGIPGGVGMGLNMMGEAAANKMFKPSPPPAPPGVGQMVGG